MVNNSINVVSKAILVGDILDFVVDIKQWKKFA